MHRELAGFECILLIKVTEWENDEDTYDVECSSSEGDILHFAILPAEVQSLFDAGELHSGEDLLRASSAMISPNGELTIPTRASISIEYMPQGRTQTTQTTGQKSVIAIRVIAADASETSSAAVLSDEIFGTSGDLVNLRERSASCSYNKFKLEPYIGTTSTGVNVTNGVYEVTIPNNVTGVDGSIIRHAVQDAGNAVLGNMREQMDHVMLCLPPGVPGSWA